MMEPDLTGKSGHVKRWGDMPGNRRFSPRVFLVTVALGTIFVLLALGLGAVLRANRARFVTYSGGLVYTSSATTLYALRASDGSIWWQRHLDDLGSFMALPDGDVLAQAGNMLVALSGADGSARWQQGPTRDVAYQPLMTAAGVIFVATTASTSLLAGGTGAVIAVRARDGHILWRFALAHGVALQVYRANDTLYIGELAQNSGGVALHAVNIQTGAPRWQADLAGGDSVIPEQSDATTVYAMIDGHDFAAFASGDGALLWRMPIAANVAPIIVAGNLYTCAAGVIAAQDAHDLTPLWQVNAGGASAVFPLGDGMIGVFMANGFVAIDAATGMPRWHSPPTQNFGPPLRHGATLYVNAAPDAYAFDLASGTTRWHVAGTAGAGATPLLNGNALYLAMGDMIYALDAQTGAPIWRRDIPQRDLLPLGLGSST